MRSTFQSIQGVVKCCVIGLRFYGTIRRHSQLWPCPDDWWKFFLPRTAIFSQRKIRNDLSVHIYLALKSWWACPVYCVQPVYMSIISGRDFHLIAGKSWMLYPRIEGAWFTTRVGSMASKTYTSSSARGLGNLHEVGQENTVHIVPFLARNNWHTATDNNCSTVHSCCCVPKPCKLQLSKLICRRGSNERWSRV